MNDAMYEHPATQANLATLRARGAIVLEPGTGALGSPGRVGDRPAARAARRCSPRSRPRSARPRPGDLDGLSVLVTAGGTREPIDAVRFIGNRSSGRMGFALADEAARRGADVTVVAANVALPRSPAVPTSTSRPPPSSAPRCEREFERCDVLLMAAAVADYRPGAPRARTRSRRTRRRGARAAARAYRGRALRASPPRRRAGQLLVGFAAETGARALEYGRAKLERKKLDAVVVNDVAQPGHRLRRPRQRGHDPHRRRASGTSRKPRRPRSRPPILDAVLSRRSSTTLRV